jgi:hypothetical protein
MIQQNKEPDYQYWLKMPYWNLREAANLLCGRDPNRNELINPSSPPKWLIEVEKTCELIERAYVSGQLRHIDKVPRNNFERYVDPIDIIYWADSNGLNIPDALSTFLFNKPGKNRAPFPCPPETEWGRIKITLVDNETVRIETPIGKGLYTFHQIGLANKRSPLKPIMLWALLKKFCQNHGEISRTNSQYDSKLPDTAKRLNKHLQNIFGINDSIYKYHYKTKKCYMTKIIFSDATNIIQPK